MLTDKSKRVIFFPRHDVWTDNCDACADIKQRIENDTHLECLYGECHERLEQVTRPLFYILKQYAVGGVYYCSVRVSGVSEQQIKVINDKMCLTLQIKGSIIIAAQGISPETNTINKQIYNQSHDGLIFWLNFSWEQNNPFLHLKCLPPTYTTFPMKYSQEQEKLFEDAIQLHNYEKSVKAALEYTYTGKIKDIENPKEYSFQELFDILECSESHLNQKLSQKLSMTCRYYQKLSMTCLYYIDERATQAEKMSTLLSIQKYAQETTLEVMLKWLENDPTLMSSLRQGIFICTKEFYKSLYTIASRNSWTDILETLTTYNSYSNICSDSFNEENNSNDIHIARVSSNTL